MCVHFIISVQLDGGTTFCCIKVFLVCCVINFIIIPLILFGAFNLLCCLI